MKVLLVTPSFDPTWGVGVNEVNLCRGLAELGTEVRVLCTTTEGITLRVRNTPMTLTPSLGRILAGFSPDLVHTIEHFQPDSQLSFFLCKRRRIPFTFTQFMYDVPPGRGRRWFPVYERLTLLPALGARKVIAVSHAAKETLMRLGVEPDKIEVIPTGIDTDAFHPSKGNGKWVREAADLSPDGKLVLTIARLHEAKGLEHLVHACALMKRRKEGILFKCVIIGTGPEKDSLQALIHALGLENEVFLWDRSFSQIQLPSIYDAADVFVLPSIYEQLGVVLLEAASMAKPTIAARVGGMRDIVRHEETGLLVPPGDSHALAKAIHYLISNPSVSERMGRNARDSMLANFDYRICARRTLDLYRKLLDTNA